MLLPCMKHWATWGETFRVPEGNGGGGGRKLEGRPDFGSFLFLSSGSMAHSEAVLRWNPIPGMVTERRWGKMVWRAPSRAEATCLGVWTPLPSAPLLCRVTRLDCGLVTAPSCIPGEHKVYSFISAAVCLPLFPWSTQSKSILRGFPSPSCKADRNLSVCCDSVVFSSRILSYYRLISPGRNLACPLSLEWCLAHCRASTFIE